MQATDILYQGYAMRGDFGNAYYYLLMNTNLADSLNNAEHVRNITKMEMNYDFEKKQELEKIRHEAEKKQQRLVIYGVISAFVILFAFLIYGIRTFRQKQKAANIIAEQKKEVETQKLIVEEKNREVHDSIVYAKRIQNAILPPDDVFQKIFKDTFIFYKPKDIVAGDFYFMEVVETGNADGKRKMKVITAVADCTGHGVPGAMVSVVCHNALKRSIREDGLIIPGEILDRTREIIIEEFSRSGSSEDAIKDGMDISLCCFTFVIDEHSAVTGTEIKSKKLESVTWSGANNPLWIIKSHQPDDSLSSGFIEYKADKQPIGVHSKMHPFTTHEIEFGEGDSFYVFSDGYADQFGGEKTKKFKSSSIKELLLSINKKSMKEQKEIIDRTFEGWKGDIEQIDDVCIIGIRI
jgi:serine phosphatase RsbU (regulator of sigma subunit)